VIYSSVRLRPRTAFRIKRSRATTIRPRPQISAQSLPIAFSNPSSCTTGKGVGSARVGEGTVGAGTNGAKVGDDTGSVIVGRGARGVAWDSSGGGVSVSTFSIEGSVGDGVGVAGPGVSVAGAGEGMGVSTGKVSVGRAGVGVKVRATTVLVGVVGPGVSVGGKGGSVGRAVGGAGVSVAVPGSSDGVMEG
jgi:hypothetical protein